MSTGVVFREHARNIFLLSTGMVFRKHEARFCRQALCFMSKPITRGFSLTGMGVREHEPDFVDRHNNI